jgi:hypothetical protein
MPVMAQNRGHPASTWRSLLCFKNYFAYRGIEMREKSVFGYRGRSYLFFAFLKKQSKQYIRTGKNFLKYWLKICEKSAESVVFSVIVHVGEGMN